MSKTKKPNKKSIVLDYRLLKKQLNPYHKFSFNLPPKGQKLSPQQKAAIMRVYNRVAPLLKQLNKEKASFIPVNYKKTKKKNIKKLEGIVTNKGMFFKYPGAAIKRDRKTGDLMVTVEYRENRELFIPFPEHIKYDLELIADYVGKKEVQYKPDYIMWSVNGYQGSEQYDPNQFYKYVTQKSDEENEIEDDLKLENSGYYTGVFFGWRPEKYKR